MGSQKLGNIRVLGEFFQHEINGNPCSPDNGLSPQNPWVGGNALCVGFRIFFHIF